MINTHFINEFGYVCLRNNYNDDVMVGNNILCNMYCNAAVRINNNHCTQNIHTPTQVRLYKIKNNTANKLVHPLTH